VIKVANEEEKRTVLAVAFDQASGFGTSIEEEIESQGWTIILARVEKDQD
jgi:hypothetical protein